MTPIQTMTDAYIEAIYFTETGDDDQPEADVDLDPYTRMQAYIDCRDFYWAVTGELDVNPCDIDWRQAGYDLWLTRNDHGAGFWDRDNDVYGDWNGTPLKSILTALAKTMGGHEAQFQE